MTGIHKILFLAGARFRNPSLWSQYRDLKISEGWTRRQLFEYQENQLLEFLDYTARNSPYYNELFTEMGWDGSGKLTMDFFGRIPVCSKETLIKENDRIHSTGFPGKLFFCETSGTSGQVLTFRRDERWDSFNRASILRGYSWYGVNGWDFNIYFWGFNFSFFRKIKVRIMDWLVNRYRLFDYSSHSLNVLAGKISGAVYIEGYSSMIYELALAANARKLRTGKLKMVKGTSEKIYPHYHKATFEAFGKRIISEYGSAETGIIAFECPQGNMHINTEGVYVETEGEEIIVTNFKSRSFPVIRYRLGDVVKLKPADFTCSCGMQHPVLEEVTGRTGQVVIGRVHRYPSLTFYYIFKNLYFEKGLDISYQAHQNQPGELEIWFRGKLSPEQEEQVIVECNKYFGDDMEVTFKYDSNFRMQKGKLKDFITTIV